MVGIVSLLFTIHWEEQIWLGPAIACWTLVGWALVSQKRAGSRLLRLGRPLVRPNWEGITFGIIGLWLLQLGILDLVKTPMDAEHIMQRLPHSIFYLSCGAWSLWLYIDGLQIRKRGIWVFGRLLRWEQINSYEWGGERGQILVVKIKRPKSPLGYWPTLWPISLARKEAADKILTQHLRVRTAE